MHPKFNTVPNKSNTIIYRHRHIHHSLINSSIISFFVSSIFSHFFSPQFQGTTMMREGQQHGMVRSYWILLNPLNPRPNTRIINRSNSPYTTRIFVRVSSKPTNHSKYTGKCGKPRCPGCHLYPAWKSKGKTKGTKKHKHLVTHYYKNKL